jgi:hypothetical protein
MGVEGSTEAARKERNAEIYDALVLGGRKFEWNKRRTASYVGFESCICEEYN